MCVAIPGRIVSIGERSGPSIPARVVFGEIERDVDLAMVSEARVGDRVIVHSGYAIRVVPEGHFAPVVETGA
ncbi:MAG: HypC/HybG/HupF family hydrogenase formation chaperone [Acidimicrobiia bacterium]|jgi:hydrogenase expression/formation protein HypC